MRSLLAAMLFFTWGLSHAECGNPFDYLKNRVVHVMNIGAGKGSGIVIDDNRVITNAHVAVLNALHQYRIDGPGMNHKPNERDILLKIRRDEVADLAELTIRTKELGPMRLYRGEIKPGQKVWVAGFPQAYPLVVVGGTANETLRRGYNKWVTFDTVLVSGLAVGGMSGGPMIICDGGKYALAGVVHAMGMQKSSIGFMRFRMPINQLAFVVAPRELRRFVEND